MGGGPTGGQVELYFSARAAAWPACSAVAAGRSPGLQGVSLLPPSGEPGKMTLGRAAQAGLERRGGVSTPISLASTLCQACYLIISPPQLFRLGGRRSEVKELTTQHC